jgi:Phage portal protein/Bacterial CdiA-CT RNAse A domain
MSLSPKDMDFIEAKHVAAREIALALGVPPMLIGIPGDNTYSNYQEATRTFWRSTVLPLVTRTAKALSCWLAPAFVIPEAASCWKHASGMGPSGTQGPQFASAEGLELRPDLDSIEALSIEREALWTRVDKATFLTQNEKRAAVGYGPVDGGDALGQKAGFRVDQQRVPAGQPGGGQWGGEDGGGDLPNAHLVQDGNPRQYSVNLSEEEVDGGHTIRDHVRKSDEYLLGEVRRVRWALGPFVGGRKQEGSFLSLEAANDFVNQVLQGNQALVDRVANGEVETATLNRRFGYITGKEAYRASGNEEPYIRPTYGVRVVIRHDQRSPRGYRVFTAFPRNELPSEQ